MNAFLSPCLPTSGRTHRHATRITCRVSSTPPRTASRRCAARAETAPKWQKQDDNYILHPDTKTTPKAVLHFIGGAFFGRDPEKVYNPLLTNLCKLNYVIVATPYSLSFNHLPIADAVSQAWRLVETDLAARYGPLPVIGLSHSFGCVLHALGSCLFDAAAPKAAHVMLAVCNRDAADAVPGLALLSRAATLPGVSTLTSVRAEAARMVKDVLPGEIGGQLAQLEDVVQEIEGGIYEFSPGRRDVEAAIGMYYPVRNTLIVRFENDHLDDSEDFVRAITRAGAEVGVASVGGGHLTAVGRVGEDLGGASVVFDVLGGNDVANVVRVVDEWIVAAIEADRL